MAEEKKIEIDVLINTSKSAKSVKDLTSSLEQLKSVASDMDTTGEEFKKISQQISITDTKVKNLTKSMEGLDADAKAGELGKLAGGLSAVGAAAALAFAGNEDAEKFFQTFAKGIAITNAIKGGIESYTASVKLLTKTTIIQDTTQKAAAAAQLLYTTAVGTSTGALKVFRLALIGTGIGAIIVGIGLLIANFDKVSEAVSNAVKKFREMGPVMKIILYPITMLIAGFDGIMFALEKLGVVDDEETKKMKANADERVTNSEKEMKAVSDKYDLEIRKAQAAGKDVTEIEQEKRRALLETIRVEGEAIKAQIIANKTVTDEQKTKLKELTELAKKTREDIAVAEIAANTKRSEEQKKIDEDNKKKREERKRIEKEERDRLEKQRLEDEAKFFERNEKEIEESQRVKDTTKEYDDEYFMGQIEESDAAVVAQEKAEEDLVKKKKEESDKALEIKRAERDATLAMASNTLNTISGFLEEGSEAGKAVAVAQTTIDTWRGAQAAYASAQANPISIIGPAYPGIMAGIAVATGLANVKKILSTKTPSKGSTPSAPSGGSSAPAAPTINPQTLFSTQQLQGAETEQVSSGGPGSQQVIKAVVSERDITSVQDRMRNYERISEIG